MDIERVALNELVKVGKELAACNAGMRGKNRMRTLTTDRQRCRLKMPNTSRQDLWRRSMEYGEINSNFWNVDIAHKPVAIRIEQIGIRLFCRVLKL